ncbi:MAG: carboxypeptidase-like regulatory domain-containing protein, partial [Candidatus Caldipriscus sp.]
MISLLISLTIKGKVMDEESSKPMGYAVVIVYRDTQRVGGTYTDTLGNFEIKGIERGNYRIVASFIGYERKEIRIDLERDTFLTITLKPKPIPIKEQVVEAEAPKVVYKVDRKVVYPKGEVEKRGRASDILRGVAGVEVDAEGNVKVMGSCGYVLFVDGKPTNMSLKDIPASFVEYIEVIT